MIFTKEQREEFERVTRPVIEFLNKNCHPHTTVTIETNHASLFEGVCAYPCEDYIPD